MKFNINGYVEVKLTDTGIEILKNEHDYYQNFRPADKREHFELKLTDDGLYRTQAWCLFETFGSHVGMGKPTPFETEIDIEC